MYTTCTNECQLAVKKSKPIFNSISYSVIFSFLTLCQIYFVKLICYTLSLYPFIKMQWHVQKSVDHIISRLTIQQKDSY